MLKVRVESLNLTRWLIGNQFNSASADDVLSLTIFSPTKDDTHKSALCTLESVATCQLYCTENGNSKASKTQVRNVLKVDIYVECFWWFNNSKAHARLSQNDVEAQFFQMSSIFITKVHMTRVFIISYVEFTPLSDSLDEVKARKIRSHLKRDVH